MNIAILLVAAPLAACQSFSFASPPVTTNVKVERYDEFDCTAVPRKSHGKTVEIEPTVIGATTLIDNFVLAYRCAEQDLANGRQIFEVPAFLAAAAGLVGPAAFGFTSKDVLKLGAAGAVLNAGNSYYAPKAKAGMLSSALRAVLCVKTEAVGIDYFRYKEEEKPDEGAQLRRSDLMTMMGVLEQERRSLEARALTESEGGKARTLLEQNETNRRSIADALTHEVVARSSRASDDEIFIDAERQYFEMVAASLFSIESVLAERLRDAGTTDTTAMFDRLKELAKESEEADDEVDSEGLFAITRGSTVPSKAELRAAVRLENKALQPKLQVYILQARL